MEGPELLGPPCACRHRQGPPRQQLRNDRGMDRDREVHRGGRSAAMNGARQLAGRGPEPPVIVESCFQRGRQFWRNVRNQQGQGRPFRAGFGGASGQAEPAERRQ